MELNETNIVFIYAASLILLFVFLKIFFTPIKIALRLIVNSVCGGIILFILNFAGSILNIHIGINFITAAVAGILGIPGISMILLLQIVLKV